MLHCSEITKIYQIYQLYVNIIEKTDDKVTHVEQKITLRIYHCWNFQVNPPVTLVVDLPLKHRMVDSSLLYSLHEIQKQIVNMIVKQNYFLNLL